MRAYTYSEARQNLASLLETAQRDGAVRIRRKDGRSFVLQPETSEVSPLDVEGFDLGLESAEIVEMIREGRERYGREDSRGQGSHRKLADLTLR